MKNIFNRRNRIARNKFLFINKTFKIKPLIHKRSIKLKNSERVNLLDIKKLKIVIKNFKPNIILHTAALTDIDKCEENKSFANDLNVKVTKILLKFQNYIIQISFYFNRSPL